MSSVVPLSECKKPPYLFIIMSSSDVGKILSQGYGVHIREIRKKSQKFILSPLKDTLQETLLSQRGRAMLSAVSFVASIVQYLKRSFFFYY